MLKSKERGTQAKTEETPLLTAAATVATSELKKVTRFWQCQAFVKLS